MARGGRVFWWVLAGAGTVMSTLAIVSLARQAFAVRSMSAPLELIVSAYAATMRVLLSWAEPSLEGTLTWLGSLIGWQPTLYLHWRDMLVVVAIWNGALVWARWRAFAVQWRASVHDGMFGFHHIFGFSFAFFVLAVGALLMATVSGVLPLRSYDITVQILIAMSSWLVFGVVMLLGRIMRRNEALGIFVFAGIAALATWWLSQALGSAGGAGIAGFAVSVIVVGVMYLVFGVFLVLSDGTSFFKSPGIYGLYIVSGFLGAALLFAVDAGLKLLGA
jgi:hypothetical protein